jgi:hypothetical protein
MFKAYGKGWTTTQVVLDIEDQAERLQQGDGMPTERPGGGTCVVCGASRSWDWLVQTPVGLVCENAKYIDGDTEKTREQRYRKTHGKTALRLAERKRHEQALIDIDGWEA